MLSVRRRRSGSADSLEDLLRKRAGGVEFCEFLAQPASRAPADFQPAIGEESVHLAITECERVGDPQRLGIPTQVVEFEPEGVARNALSDRDREFDEEVVE